MPLMNGQTFAGYQIIRLLGSGGMGEVYLAQHPRLPRRDALKLLPRDWSADVDYRARFNREADLASTLWHPNIVGVHDRGEEDGQLWISMDYVDGLDAARLLADRYPAGMPVEDVARIVTAVASALDYAHKQGLLHRDVKPSNIMLAHLDDEDEQRILLTDFGIARNINDISGLTTTNTTVGTVAYAAPEQLLGEDIDGRADQYALAATTYYLLTGITLYPSTNPAVVISKHLNVPPPPLADVNPELAVIDAVLAAGLAKSPNDRFLRCSDFAQALKEQASARNSASPLAPTMPAPVPPRSASPQGSTPKPAIPAHGGVGRSHRWLITIGIGAILVLGIFAAILWPAQHKSRTPATNATSASAPSLPTTALPSPTTRPPPPVFPATAIDTLILGIGAVNATLGTTTLAVKDSSFGTSDTTADITPAACAGVVHAAEQLVYRDTGFVQMRNQHLYPRPYTESQVIDSGGPWEGQQTVVVFPTEAQAQSVLTSSEDRWRSCASESVMEKGYEFTVPWALRNIQLRGDVLTVSLVDPSPVPGPNAGACQHALGVRLNVLAEAVTCTAHTAVAGNGAERIVFAILDKVHV